MEAGEGGGVGDGGTFLPANTKPAGSRPPSISSTATRVEHQGLSALPQQ